MFTKPVLPKVGEIVKVPVLKYKGFRGIIVNIDNGVAEVHVPTYYGNKEVVVIYKELKDLTKAK